MGPLPDFRIDTLQTESGTTIKLAGELDSETSTMLMERFEQVLEAPGAGPLVIDLEEVSFIDSSGLRAIIMIERRSRADGIDVSIVQPPDEVTELLRVTGLTDRIELAPGADATAPAEPFIERTEIELAREPTAPGRARAELRQAISGRLPEQEAAAATLLTSELVTNAVIHPRDAVAGSVGLQITAYPDRIRVEVTDPGSGFDPATLPPGPRETGGHGLIVVEGLSSRWGITRRLADGEELFCVWFELDAEDAQAAELEDSAESVLDA